MCTISVKMNFKREQIAFLCPGIKHCPACMAVTSKLFSFHKNPSYSITVHEQENGMHKILLRS